MKNLNEGFQWGGEVEEGQRAGTVNDESFKGFYSLGAQAPGCPSSYGRSWAGQPNSQANRSAPTNTQRIIDTWGLLRAGLACCQNS